MTTTYAANSLNQYYRADTDSPTPVKQHFGYDADGNMTNAYIVGDMNCDGQMNNFDLDPFVLAITNPGQYESQYPDCDILNGDVDGNGTVNNFDVDDFVALLTSGNDAISVEYVWDGENRLKEFIPQSPQLGATHKLEFVYDYLGRRVHKKVYDWDSQAGNWEATTSEERKFIYDDWRLLLELDDSNDVLRKYTWGRDLSDSLGGAGGIGGLLSVYDADAEDDYVYFYDSNGNVGQLVDLGAAGAGTSVVAHYEYDPYGKVASQSGAYAATNPFRFSTKYLDDESSLSDFGNRYYHAGLGRWLNRDPIGEPGGVNLYAYALNAPSNLGDYLGYLVLGGFGPCPKVGGPPPDVHVPGWTPEPQNPVEAWKEYCEDYPCAPGSHGEPDWAHLGACECVRDEGSECGSDQLLNSRTGECINKSDIPPCPPGYIDKGFVFDGQNWSRNCKKPPPPPPAPFRPFGPNCSRSDCMTAVGAAGTACELSCALGCLVFGPAWPLCMTACTVGCLGGSGYTVFEDCLRCPFP